MAKAKRFPKDQLAKSVTIKLVQPSGRFAVSDIIVVELVRELLVYGHQFSVNGNTVVVTSDMDSDGDLHAVWQLQSIIPIWAERMGIAKPIITAVLAG